MAGGKDASQPLQKLPVAPVILWAPNNLGLGGAAQTKEVPRAMPVCSWQPRRPSFWSRFLLLCLVRGEDRKWEHGALDTFFVETWEPTPFLAPRPPPGRLGAFDCQQQPGPKASLLPAGAPRESSGRSGPRRDEPSCHFRGSAPRCRSRGLMATLASQARAFICPSHSLSGIAPLKAERRGAVSRGPSLARLEVTLRLQAGFPLPFPDTVRLLNPVK